MESFSAIPPPDTGDVRAWRRSLHQIPEPGFGEIKTSRFVADRLASFGIDTHEGIGGTGVVGVLRRGESERSIALRADMDALKIEERSGLEHASLHPGMMHACGHDGHTAMLLGAARHLALHGRFSGTVVFVFQPNEEHGCGARAMIEAGLLERFPFDEIYGLHNSPGLPIGHLATRCGPLTACEDTFEIRLTGTGGHAARPQSSNDALVAAAHLIIALQTIVSRRTAPLDNAVVSVTEVIADGARNVLPETVIIKGDARSYTKEVRELIEREMRVISSGIASTFGATVTVSYLHEFAATVNHPEQTKHALAAAALALGQANVNGSARPGMGSEDFGVFLEHRPGNFAYLGNGTSGPSGRPLHNPHYDFNDDALAPGIAYWSVLVHARLDSN